MCFTFEEADAIGDSLEMRDVWHRAFAREFLRVKNREAALEERAKQNAQWRDKYDQSQNDLAHCNMDLANTTVYLSNERHRRKGKGLAFVLGFSGGAVVTVLVVKAVE